MKNLFDGIRVVDFSGVLAGPHPTAMLADFGAEVIKIEKSKTGDDMRSFLPQFEGTGVPFFMMNRGKKSIVLELADSDGIEIANKLVETADIVVENFRPGVMKKFGLSYEDVKKINPNVIYCSISAFGQEGPYSKKPGYDLLAQAISGAMDLTGDADGDPARLGFVLGDYAAGCYAFGAIASALFHRERTGIGQHIDLSLVDSLVSYNHYMEGVNFGENPRRTGNNSPGAAPFGIFEGSNNEFAVVCAINPKHWGLLCNVLGKEAWLEDPEFITRAARLKNADRITAAIEEWLQSFEKIEEPIKIMDEIGVPTAKVNSTADMLNDDYLISRGMIVDLELPDGMSVKTIKAKGNPLRFSEAKAVLGKAPTLGQHEDEVLQSLGYDDAKITELKKKWGL